MIRLFVLDIDGCLSYPFRSPIWPDLGKIRDLNNLSRSDSSIPPITICSGRPLPYVEAVAQWLDVGYPVLFESGAGIYTVRNNELKWHPVVTDDALKQNRELAEFVDKEVIPRYPGMFREFSKFTDVGMVSAKEVDIQHACEQIISHVDGNYPGFEVHHTEVSVNVILRNCNKGEGLRFLSEITSIPLSEMAYIGDSSGDITALKLVGRAFAPSNATIGVKEVAEVLEMETSGAILAAYNILIKENRNS
jgi:hydroxymethylpyrimidine pyrophosphatase-like HAD family hydrolase